MSLPHCNRQQKIDIPLYNYLYYFFFIYSSFMMYSYENNKIFIVNTEVINFLVPGTTALNPKFRYAAGKTYTYNFEARSKTWMMGTSDDEAVLEVKGQALVTFRDSCDAVLQLRQATRPNLLA